MRERIAEQPASEFARRLILSACARFSLGNIGAVQPPGQGICLQICKPWLTATRADKFDLRPLVPDRADGTRGKTRDETLATPPPLPRYPGEERRGEGVSLVDTAQGSAKPPVTGGG